jgi:hypothetical protein
MRFVQVHVTRLHTARLWARDYSFGLAVGFRLLAAAELVLRMALVEQRDETRRDRLTHIQSALSASSSCVEGIK